MTSAHFDLAVTSGQEECLEQRASDIFLWVAEHEPKNPMWKHNVALALMNDGRFIEALELFDKLAKKHSDLSRVHNNRAVLLLRLGFEPRYLAPAFLLALQTSRDIPEFTRHLHNLCAAIAFGTDNDAATPLTAIEEVLPKALKHISPKKMFRENLTILTRMVAAFSKVASYREAFANKNWNVAGRELDSARKMFEELGFPGKNLNKAGECLKICKEIIGTLERLSTDQSLRPDIVFEKFKSLFQEIDVLETTEPGDLLIRFTNVLGWFVAGCREMFGYLSSPENSYEANDEPQRQIHQLTAISFIEIGRDLASFLQFLNKQCVALSQANQAIASREQIFAHRDEAWRKIVLFSSALHFNFSNIDTTLANEMLGWRTSAVDEAKLEVQKFKLFMERQAFRDVFVDGNLPPKFEFARMILFPMTLHGLIAQFCSFFLGHTIVVPAKQLFIKPL